MSANDRTSCISNWESAGFNKISEDDRTWVVTVINNRDDRTMRSREFAEILVQDTPANLHFLIGTNLNGFIGYLKDALRRFVQKKYLIREDSKPHFPNAVEQHCMKTVFMTLSRMRINGITENAIQEKLRIMLNGTVPTMPLERLFQQLLPLDNVSEISECLEQNVPDKMSNLMSISNQIRDFKRISRFHESLKTLIPHLSETSNIPAKINQNFQNLLTELLMDRVIPIHNPYVSGEQIIDMISRNTPPFYRIKIMGMQNIKGTGLDFIYRWISLTEVQNSICDLASNELETRVKAANWLAAHDDYGILDAPLASTHLKKAAKDPGNQSPEILTVLKDALTHVSDINEKREHRLKTDGKSGVKRLLLRLIEQLIDLGDSKRRQRKVKQVMNDLFNERISHKRAAKIIHELVKRQEGGWLLNKFETNSTLKDNNFPGK